MGEQREFLTEKHAKFFQRCLLLLPAKLQGEDANRLSFIYFCLHGLGLLKQLKYTKEELQSYSDFIYKDYLLENDDFSAFRATPYFKGLSKYDLPNLSSTLFALLNLLILESDYSKVLDNHKVMKFLQLSQIKEGENKGSFAPTLRNGDNGEYVQFGETDVRLCYIAASIRHLVKYDTLGEEERKNDIDTKALTDFILLRIDYQGGLSFTKHVESHLGFSYCGIACLKLAFGIRIWLRFPKDSQLACSQTSGFSTATLRFWIRIPRRRRHRSIQWARKQVWRYLLFVVVYCKFGIDKH